MDAEAKLQVALGLLRRCVEVMEIQEKRQAEEFHLSAAAFVPLWKAAIADARAVLAQPPTREGVR
jgi:hypothetical protein